MIVLSDTRAQRDARVIAALKAEDRLGEYNLAAVRGSVLHAVMAYSQEALDVTPRWRLFTRARLRSQRDLMLVMFEQHVGQQMLREEGIG